MGGHQNGQIVGLPNLIQHVHQGGHALHIHAGKGFVQNQDIGDGFQRQGQQHPLQFSAGKRAHPLVDQILTVNPVQAFQNGLPHGLGDTQKSGTLAHAAGEKIRNGNRLPGIKAGALGHIADSWLVAALSRFRKGDDAGIFPLAQNGFQEGAFAGAVGTDQGHHFPAVYMETHVLQNVGSADFHRQIFYPQAAGVTAGAAVVQFVHSIASLIVRMFRYMASK